MGGMVAKRTLQSGKRAKGRLQRKTLWSPLLLMPIRDIKDGRDDTMTAISDWDQRYSG
jgi:hypothetical protein